VPEWPIGTALKAVAGRDVSRGFESRPLCYTGDCAADEESGVLVAPLPAMTGDGAIGTDAHDRPWRRVAAGAVFVVVSPVAAIASRNTHGG
jgi:hypothetical protein